MRLGEATIVQAGVLGRGGAERGSRVLADLGEGWGEVELDCEVQTSTCV